MTTKLCIHWRFELILYRAKTYHKEYLVEQVMGSMHSQVNTSVELVGRAKMMSHCRVYVGNQVQSDSIFFNTMYNNLHYNKIFQNPAWQTLVPVLLFKVYSRYICHESFSFMMSLPAISFGDRFCFSRKGRIGGGGRVQTAWPRLGSAVETTWLALGEPFLSFLA